jgi:hypothetical protein
MATSILPSEIRHPEPSMVSLLEALSVILPERFGVELSEVIDPSIRREVSLQSIIDALKWRDPDSITARTVSVVREALVFKIWQHER